MRRKKTWLLATGVSCALIAMSLGASAYPAAAEPVAEPTEGLEEPAAAGVTPMTVGTCTSAVGTTLFRLNGEVAWLENAVYTNLARSQRFVFKVHREPLVLTKLVRASCAVKQWNDVTASVFTGGGDATLGGEPGYRVGFRISLTRRGQLILDIRVFKGKEKTARYNYLLKNMETVG